MQAPLGAPLLLDHLPLGALIIDLDGRVLRCNDLYLHFAGERPEFLTRAVSASQDTFVLFLLNLRRYGLSECSQDLVRADGQLRRVHLQAVSIDAGSALVLLRDMTDHHLLEVDYRRFRLAVEACDELVLVVDQGGGIVFANAASEPILGFASQHMIGLALFDFVHPLDLAQTWQMLQESVEHQQRLHGQVRLLTRQRDVRHLRCTAISVGAHFGGGSEVLLVARDSTDQHNLQQALIESQKMEGMGRLASGIAHDFNNLLQLILGSVQCLETEADIPERAREWLDTISTAADRGHKVIEQLQAFSRRDVGVRLPCTIKDLLSSLSTLVRPILTSDARLRFEPAHAMSVVEVDVGQVHQVLLNLVINAREALGDTGEIVIASDEVIRQDKVWARVTVRDNGRGIPEEHLSRIFEPFFSTKESRRCTGLGLAVAYGLIESHGGRIEVESLVGEGSAFHVLLPLAPEGTRALCVDREPTQVFGNDELILVVDDEPMQRLILQRQLEFLGYDVLTAEDGEHALDLFRDYGDEIGCVLLDVVMPRRDGIETLLAMRTAKPDVAVIVTSGLGRDERVAAMLQGGARRFLPKPFRIEHLSTTLREVLDDASTDAELENAHD
jgi:two-component system, cell cycle sensor histidine kinase and response regulator CckA